MTKRNFRARADRGNKLEKAKGFAGASYGAAGPCIRVPIDSIDIEPPSDATKFQRAYAAYAKDQRNIGRKPLPPTEWRRAWRARTNPTRTRGPATGAPALSSAQGRSA